MGGVTRTQYRRINEGDDMKGEIKGVGGDNTEKNEGGDLKG